MRKILTAERRKIGNKLHPLTSHFHDYIPLNLVSEILADHGLILLQEDNTEWSGIFCGVEANTVFTLGDITTKNELGEYEPIKTGLYFYWYKRQETGRYEINMYLT